MSREPITPNDDAGPAGSGQQATDIPVGRRWTNNEEILQIEERLARDGVELPNRAIHMSYHPTKRQYDDADEVRELIEEEAQRDHPNKSLIAFLNDQL